MSNWIGSKIEENPQLQEFIEKCIGYTFDRLTEEYEDGMVDEDDADEIFDMSSFEVMWFFEQLGCKNDREEVEDGGEEEN